jgi:hypothetical protein
MLTAFALLVLSAYPGSSGGVGTIRGVVLDGTHRQKPLENVVVVLRAGPDGALTPVDETVTDRLGNFVFENLPLDPAITYLPGADRHGVHYPGRRTRLDATTPSAQTRIVTFDAVESPSPLVAQRLEIEIEVRHELLEVRETLLVENASDQTYVGEQNDGVPPVTMRLAVPPNFDRVTFGSEFYGRRFQVVEHQLVTDIPWPPGVRELKYAYRVPTATAGAVFRRTVDLPARNVTLRVHGDALETTSCNLPLARTSESSAVFASEDVAAGHSIELIVGDLPFPWIQCARWGAVATLAALVLATAAKLRLQLGRKPESHRPDELLHGVR